MFKIQNFSIYLLILLYNGGLYFFIKNGWFMPLLIINTTIMLFFTYIATMYRLEVLEIIEDLKRKND
jgi:hypothetical protein